MEYLLAIATLIAGFLTAWFVAMRRMSKQSEIQDNKEKELLSQLANSEKDKSVS